MRVEEIGDVQLGRQRSPKNRSAEYPTKYLRAANITESGLDLGDVLEMDFKPEERERYRLTPGDIVLSEASGSASQVGKPALWGGELPLCCFQNTVIRLRPKHADPKYLLWVFTHFYRNGVFSRVAAGVGINHLSAAKFKQLEVPVPPLPEQRRIVAEIEKQFTRLDAGVAALRRVQANLKRYRAAVLKAACEGQLLDSPDANWQAKKIGDLAELVTKGSSPNWQGFDYCESGIVFVRSQNVGWGTLELSDVARLPIEFNEKERKSVLKAGDVLLNIVGASIGRATVATAEIEGGNVNQAVAVIRLRPNIVLSQYLVCYLLSHGAQTLIHSQKVDVARANLSLEQIRNIPVSLPSLGEQKRIVAEVERRLSVIDELEALVTANLARAGRLRRSILVKSFAP